jgi:hypothetical protein
MLKLLFAWFSQRSRRNRADIIKLRISLPPSASILDLGGGTGAHILSIFNDRQNIVVGDISEADLAVARQHGLRTVRLNETATLPFHDKQFDFCFCSSVIEHCTGEKQVILTMKDGDRFKEIAWEHQTLLASEIRRVAKTYYVQTPYRYFLIESHTWLPFIIVLFPRSLQLGVINVFNRFWPKKTSPDWNLLTATQMQMLFPDAEIIVERFLGLIKSIAAIKV